MKISWLIALFFTIVSDQAIGQQIERISRIDIPLTKRSKQFGTNKTFAEWITENDIVAFTRDWRLSRIDTSTFKRKWSHIWLNGVSDWSVCRSAKQIGLIGSSDVSGSIDDLLASKKIMLVDSEDGSVIFSKNAQWFEKQTNEQSFFPSRISLHPIDGRMLITDFSTHFGKNAYLLSTNRKSVDHAIGIDAMPKQLEFSPDGNRLTVLADFDVLNVRDIKKNSDVYFDGKRFEKPRDSITSVVDAPFYSNAYHDGENLLVYSRDNSWGTGRIYVRRLDTKTATEFDGLNGHIVMDTDFTNKRIAVSGTSKNIYLFDFTGKKLAELIGPTGKRNFGIRFSPNGEKILICNGDAIWIFRISTK